MWYVYYDPNKSQYQITTEKDSNTPMPEWLAIFRNFDMAYDYVTKANKMSDVMAYSRWAR